MNIGLFRGFLLSAGGKESKVWWAHTSARFWVLVEGSNEVTHESQPPVVRSAERVTVLELPEIEDQCTEDIIVNILKGGYLDKPGVKDSGDAALFMLVNEAIQKLSEISKDVESS